MYGHAVLTPEMIGWRMVASNISYHFVMRPCMGTPRGNRFKEENI